MVARRDVRDFEHAGQEFADAKVHPRRIGPGEVLFERERLDKQGRYALKITVHDGTIGLEKGIVLRSHAGPLRFRVEILNSETPLRPMPITQIFKPDVARARMSIADIESALYLTTADKILAGSWRYQTFFGRDPKLTQLYAADYLEPEVMEAELAAVFSRLDTSGDAAHEENLGDSATRQNLAEGRGAVSTTILDYKMVDHRLFSRRALTGVPQKSFARTRGFVFARANIDRDVNIPAGLAREFRTRDSACASL